MRCSTWIFIYYSTKEPVLLVSKVFPSVYKYWTHPATSPQPLVFSHSPANTFTHWSRSTIFRLGATLFGNDFRFSNLFTQVVRFWSHLPQFILDLLAPVHKSLPPSTGYAPCSSKNRTCNNEFDSLDFISVNLESPAVTRIHWRQR